MPVTRRMLVDNFVGLLKNGVSAVGTTLVSDNFPSLPDTFSTTTAMPMHICDDSQGIFETVLVTGHGAGTTSVTVIRGAHGTTARSWDAGAIVRVGVSLRELTQAMTASAANALSDTHVGMEITDENLLQRKQTARQGFQPLARFMSTSVGSGIGQGIAGAVANNGQLDLLAQTFLLSGQTTSAGYVGANLPAGAFPNGLVACVATPLGAQATSYVPILDNVFTDSTGASGSTKGPWLSFRCMRISDGNPLSGGAVKFSVVALGV